MGLKVREIEEVETGVRRGKEEKKSQGEDCIQSDGCACGMQRRGSTPACALKGNGNYKRLWHYIHR